jgi:hypothetical protein
LEVVAVDVGPEVPHGSIDVTAVEPRQKGIVRTDADNVILSDELDSVLLPPCSMINVARSLNWSVKM